MRIVFCGETFPAARVLLQERLPGDECVVWRDCRVLEPTSYVDVLIPMMFRIDAAVIDRACPRLIQQWGSGLEGVDLQAARARGIPVASVAASAATPSR